MDILPLVIHYPIAFLTTYCLFEFLNFRRLTSLLYWHNLKFILLILGEVATVATLIAAIFSTSILAGESRLGDMVKLFILITVLIFAIQSTLYIKKVQNKYVMLSLALVGLFAIVVTGGLFGAVAYGTHFDPFMAPIFKFLGVY